MILFQGGGSLVTAPTSPAPWWAAPDLGHYRHTLQKVGSKRVWDICTGAHGIFLMPGVRGIHWPEAIIKSSVAANVNGASEDGYRIATRDVVLPLELWRDGSEAWARLYRQFMQDVSWRNLVWWSITDTRTGLTRRLLVRFRADGQQSFEQAPEYVGRVELVMLADARIQPMWQGEPQMQSWGNSTALPFHADGNINISSSQDIGNASITNTGTEPTSISAIINGPWDPGFRLTIDGRSIVLAKAVSAAQTVVADTSNTRPGLFSTDGANLTRGWVSRFDRVLIPPGATSRVEIVGAGTGGVQLFMVPLYDDGFPVAPIDDALGILDANGNPMEE